MRWIPPPGCRMSLDSPSNAPTVPVESNPTKPAPKPAARKAGDAGESCAQRFLEDQGLRIVKLNWQCKMGEIDLIATDGETTVFVEVKTRGGAGHGTPAESVDRFKRQKIIRAATLYAVMNHLQDKPMRFDIVEVHTYQNSPPRCVHWKDAFAPRGFSPI